MGLRDWMPAASVRLRQVTRVCAALPALMGLLVIGHIGLAKAADAPALAVELNKLEPQAKACRAYVVVDNPSAQAFQALKLDLIFFRTDGVIDRRLLLDLAPLRSSHKSVKIFDLDALTCEGIGSVLVNDVTECRDASGPLADCLGKVTFSSRASATLSK